MIDNPPKNIFDGANIYFVSISQTLPPTWLWLTEVLRDKMIASWQECLNFPEVLSKVKVGSTLLIEVYLVIQER